jgi:hypothetical protein
VKTEESALSERAWEEECHLGGTNCILGEEFLLPFLHGVGKRLP